MFRKFTVIIAVALTLTVMLWTATAEAQQLGLAAAADVFSGVEGGGGAYASGIRRSRTTVKLGVEGWIDESPNDHVGASLMVEIEPRASVGAELRYVRLLGDSFLFHGGAIGVIAPRHMLGVTAGAAFRIPLGEAASLNVGPAANVYFLGSDLPESNVLWQGTLQVGVRVGL